MWVIFIHICPSMLHPANEFLNSLSATQILAARAPDFFLFHKESGAAGRYRSTQKPASSG